VVLAVLAVEALETAQVQELPAPQIQAAVVEVAMVVAVQQAAQVS
jgi:hypothetical protein